MSETLSNRDARILAQKLDNTNEDVWIEKKEFRTATSKKLAFHCYYNKILFHWSNKYYVFRKTEEILND